jgi:hypothetical protein
MVGNASPKDVGEDTITRQKPIGEGRQRAIGKVRTSGTLWEHYSLNREFGNRSTRSKPAFSVIGQFSCSRLPGWKTGQWRRIFGE